jgi:type IV secretory pathway VirB4 component
MDHPLCKECTQKTLKSLETQLAEATKENSAYKMFLKKLKGENEKYPLESQLDEEIIKVRIDIRVYQTHLNIYHCRWKKKKQNYERD